MLLTVVAATSERVAATASRKAKTALVASCLEQARSEGSPDAGPPTALLCAAYLSGQVLQDRLGVGYAAVRDVTRVASLPNAELDVQEVHAVLDTIATCAGLGSKQRKQDLLKGLFARATGEEQQFLAKLLLGELRQGALQGVLLDAVAQVTGIAATALRRALLLGGDLTTVAARALLEGEAGLETFRLRVFQPLAPMLAQPSDFEEALSQSPHPQAEYKLDGARVQVHKLGDEVKVYSRLLNDVSAAVPEVIATAQQLPVHSAVLDGEAIAMHADGRPQPFQVTMRRFGRKASQAKLLEEIPLTCFFFDCLHVDGQDLFAAPFEERATMLERLVPAAARVTARRVTIREELDAFFSQALAAGHEGLVVKDVRAAYEPGRRGSSWLKLKPVHTLDLVVLAAEWGSGRRQGTLSNLHLGARSADGFVMLGKTFKGLTDELLAFQTQELLKRELRREGHIVHVRPELVVEIAFDGVQSSTQYPGGVALRFARVKRYRPDKVADQADSIEQVRAFLPPRPV